MHACAQTGNSQELRKDKIDRTPGGVTPGEDPNYYAAVARADEKPGAAKPKAILKAGGGRRAGGANQVCTSSLYSLLGAIRVHEASIHRLTRYVCFGNGLLSLVGFARSCVLQAATPRFLWDAKSRLGVLRNGCVLRFCFFLALGWHSVVYVGLQQE